MHARQRYNWTCNERAHASVCITATIAGAPNQAQLLLTNGTGHNSIPTGESYETLLVFVAGTAMN